MPSPAFLALRRRALAHLKSSEPVMADLVRRVGPCTLAPAAAMPPFQALAHSILHQQLAGKAAATIMARFVALYSPKKFPAPEDVLATPPEKLRRAGLSSQKAGYLRGLAGMAASGELRLHQLHRMADGEVMDELTKAKGVGEWTAHMYLLFRLGRPDVLPVGDYGVRKAAQEAYGLRALPSPQRLEKLAKPWRPYASFASWYLWRSLDGE